MVLLLKNLLFIALHTNKSYFVLKLRQEKAAKRIQQLEMRGHDVSGLKTRMFNLLFSQFSFSILYLSYKLFIDVANYGNV